MFKGFLSFLFKALFKGFLSFAQGLFKGFLLKRIPVKEARCKEQSFEEAALPLLAMSLSLEKGPCHSSLFSASFQDLRGIGRQRVSY